MPELEFVGVWLGQRITGIHNNAMERRLGRPDAICRSGCRDNPLWLADRCWRYAADKTTSSGPSSPPTFYTTVEGARLVGVTVRALQKILGNKPPCALLLPASQVRTEPLPLWSERLLFVIRRLISSGDIEVRRSSLTRPKYGAKICHARHVWAADQTRESESLRKAHPLDYIIW